MAMDVTPIMADPNPMAKRMATKNAKPGLSIARNEVTPVMTRPRRNTFLIP